MLTIGLVVMSMAFGGCYFRTDDQQLLRFANEIESMDFSTEKNMWEKGTYKKFVKTNIFTRLNEINQYLNTENVSLYATSPSLKKYYYKIEVWLKNRDVQNSAEILKATLLAILLPRELNTDNHEDLLISMYDDEKILNRLKMAKSARYPLGTYYYETCLVYLGKIPSTKILLEDIKQGYTQCYVYLTDKN